MAIRGQSAPVEMIATPRLASPLERHSPGSPGIPVVQARVVRVIPAPEAQSASDRRDADEQLWWSERVRKITASIDQKLNTVVGADSSPVSQPRVLDSRVLEVEVHVEPARNDPPPMETIRAAAFEHQEGCNELRACSPGRGIADEEIPSAFATIRSMRHEIEVLRERQQCEARSAQVGLDSSFGSRAPTPPFPPLRSSIRDFHAPVRGESAAVSEPKLERGTRICSPVEPSPSVSLRQEQQELRILALQAKLRHLEQQLGGEMPRNVELQETFAAAAPLSVPDNFDMLLEAEIGSLKQELKAQHMEHAVGMVQEANVLRKDVSLALRNEREARCEEVAELRSTLDAVQDRLMSEFHETMDLIGSRLEQHLQAAVDPVRIDEIVSKRLEMVRILSRATDIQHGSASGGETVPMTEINIEREARCRSIIDLRMEMEGKLVEGMERFEEQCASLTADMSELRETVARLVNNSQVNTGVSSDHRGGAFSSSDVNVLIEQLRVEKTTRASEIKELSERFEALASRADAAAAHTASSESIAITPVESLHLVEKQIKDIERERSLWQATAHELKELRDSIGSEFDDIRRREDAHAKAFELAVDCERQARASETSELRARLEKVPDDSSKPSTAGREGVDHIHGELNTLYGMLKEALSDTVRLSVEIDTERKTRQKEFIEMRRLVGTN